MLHVWLTGFEGLLQLRELTFLALGMIIGLIFGAIPGIGGSTALALLMPLTYGLEPFTALALSGGVMGAVPMGGSITAILLNAPGTAPNAATCLDGYPLAQQGKAGLAIGAAASANSLGGIIGTISVLAVLPIAKELILLFGPPEFFLLAILGLVVVATTSRGKMLRGLITGGFGLMVAFIAAEKAPHLWGGFAQYVYLPWNAVVHHVPPGVTPELAGLVTPMANGVEWSLFEGGVGYNSTVLIQGPGQQGLSQTVICKQAGASLIIVTGTSKDAARLEVAKKLGADTVIDVQKQDPLARIKEITGGKGVDVVLDCTAGAGTLPILLGVEALKRKAGTIVVQGEMADFPNFPLGRVTVKYITIRSARGHSYKACELALAQLASKRFPLELITTHKFGLNDVDLAIKSVGGQGVPDVIHASLMPWL